VIRRTLFMRSHGCVMALLLMAAVVHGDSRQAGPVTVQLLAINDFHGNLEPPAGAAGQVQQIPAGGVEYLATHLRKAARETPNSMVVAAGDLIGGSPLLSALFQDAPTLEALNALPLAVSSIGNHELDHGPADLLRKLQGARFQYLAANVVRTDGDRTTLLPTTYVSTIGGVKIGFIGETLAATPDIIPRSSSRGLQFLDESRVANEAAAELERAGTHAIVLLIHQGGQQHPAGGPIDPNGCANFGGDITKVLGGLSPAIKVVISGHTHQYYNCTIDGRIVTSAGDYGRLFTRLTLSIDPVRDTIEQVSAHNEIVTRDVPKDPALTAILDKYRPEATRLANKPVGVITEEITNEGNRDGESALGDVIADAELASARASDRGGAALAFIHAGGIRASLSGTPRDDGRRGVTYGDLFAVQPFGNHITVLTMTGDMIRRVLEQQFSTGRPRLQVSEGFHYEYQREAPPGQHVVDGSIRLHGRPLTAADTVRVALPDILAGGAGGLSVFREGRDAVIGPVDIEALTQYISAQSLVRPGPRNRFVRID